ncbi:MAG TPA: nuclear transport factor 2 family protein [Candidatus Bathyarchaeia archaeon]|nr:nuclear transport factor 2 family protein [Candidatus Bathyarchaeia archaeon]
MNQLKDFFEEFETAIGDRDYARIAALFADRFIVAGPMGSVIRTRTEFVTQMRAASAFYEKVGQTSLRIILMKETPISEHHSLVSVRWGATFRTTGDLVMELVDSYVVQMRGEAPEIILLIAHQDERELLERWGLVSNS